MTKESIEFLEKQTTAVLESRIKEIKDVQVKFPLVYCQTPDFELEIRVINAILKERQDGNK